MIYSVSNRLFHFAKMNFLIIFECFETYLLFFRIFEYIIVIFLSPIAINKQH